jgi:hypothetical protein
MNNETVTFRRVGNWILEWESTRPNTVWAIPEYLKLITYSDSGILYDSGTMAWNYPERIPAYVRNAAPSFIVKCQNRGR